MSRTLDRISVISAIVSTICAVIATGLAIKGCFREKASERRSLESLSIASNANAIAQEALAVHKATSQQTVEPDIRIYVEGNIPSAEMVVYNNGPIPAVSLSVEKRHIHASRESGNADIEITPPRPWPRGDSDPEDRLWQFMPVLEAKQSFRGELGAGGGVVNGGGKWTTVEVIRIRAHWFRKTDMKEFTKEVLFFNVDLKLYNHAEFQTHELYETVMRGYLGRVMREREGRLEWIRKAQLELKRLKPE